MSMTDILDCQRRTHCATCRDFDEGRPFRESIAKRVPDLPVDFECPHGVKWGERPEQTKKPCGGCGDKKAKPRIGHPRKSCRECVEKHIGAAMVILGEAAKGYDHHLLAVGHLHEAEEESAREWPALSVRIRAARKGLQSSNRNPEWESIWMEMTRAFSPASPTGGHILSANGNTTRP